MRCLSWAKYFEHHIFHHEITNECGHYASQYGKTRPADFVTKLKAKSKANDAGEKVRNESPKMKFIFGIAHTV